MHVTIVTAFPEFFGDFLSTSILGRAVKQGLVCVDLVDLREFGRGGYRQIDDYAFGSLSFSYSKFSSLSIISN